MTAQEEYWALLREHLSARLRQRQFRGSGAAWTLPSDTHWLRIGWQKSRHSTRELVEFTCNLKVISKALWDAENTPRGRIEDQPAPNTHYGVGWEQRLGGLVPGSRGDKWWTVRPGEDGSELADNVMATLDEYGLPAMDARLAAELAQRPDCAHNVGTRNSYRPCGLPAEVVLGGKDRRYFLCVEHSQQLVANGGHAVLGPWPSLY
jgi:hypothetical protein